VHVLVWIADGTWTGCVDAARTWAPADAEFTLLHVPGTDEPAAAAGAFSGLLGRGHPERDPGRRVADLADEHADDLLRAAADRLGHAATAVVRHGRVEREVVAAAADADVLVLARDGDRTRLGPKSLGPATRFVVDHAPCPVLLVWPEPAPDTGTLPPVP
jgi:nucleotide-binding universal stress UspA family protein